MTTQRELLRDLETYIGKFGGEAGRLERFGDFIRRFDGPELYDRKNFVGHITASGMVYRPETDELLLLEHVQLKKWLQPGGHVEPTDASILSAAMREVQEETGLTPQVLSLCTAESGFAIVDIDSHYIPPCDYKAEDEHYHHDVRFLFALMDENAAIDLDFNESHDFRWMKVRDIPDNYGFSRLEAKLPLFYCR